MPADTITLRTETGQDLEATLLQLYADRIEVLIGGEFRCTLRPSRNQRAYVGTLRGRDVVYARSVVEVRAELAKRDRAHRRVR